MVEPSGERAMQRGCMLSPSIMPVSSSGRAAPWLRHICSMSNVASVTSQWPACATTTAERLQADRQGCEDANASMSVPRLGHTLGALPDVDRASSPCMP